MIRDPDIRQALDDNRGRWAEYHALRERRTALPAHTTLQLRAEIDQQIGDILGIVRARAERIAIDFDTLAAILEVERALRAASKRKPQGKAVATALADRAKAAGIEEHAAHEALTIAQGRVARATRQRVAAEAAHAAIGAA